MKKQISFIGQKQSLYSYIVFMPLLFMWGLVFGYFSSPYSFVPLCASFTVFFAITVLRAIKRYGFFSLYCLYLYTAFFFMYSKLFFHALGIVDFRYVEFPGKYYFSETTGIIFIVSSFISFYVLDIFMFLLSSKRRLHNMARRVSHHRRLQNIGLFCMTVSFPVILYKMYLQLQVIKQTGYVAIYTGALGNLRYPWWTAGSGTLFYMGFLLLLMSFPKKSAFIFGVFLFLFFSLVDALKGRRGDFMASVFASLYFFQSLYGMRLTAKKILPLVFVLFMFAAVMGRAREETGGGNQFSKITGTLLTKFIMGQNVSIGVPLGVIEFSQEQKEFRAYPYIFSPLLSPLYDIISPQTGAVPSIERLHVRNEMEGIITYIYSPSIYAAGYGIGAALLGEMIDCVGLFGIVFWSCMLGFLILTAEGMLYKSNWFLLWAWFIVCAVIMMPRAHFFAFVVGGYRYFFLIAVFVVCINTLFFPKKLHVSRRYYA